MRESEPPTPPAFRVCATCANLKVLEQGREFAGIADTEFLRFRCTALGREGREDYLMAPAPRELPDAPAQPCPFWTPPR